MRLFRDRPTTLSEFAGLRRTPSNSDETRRTAPERTYSGFSGIFGSLCIPTLIRRWEFQVGEDIRELEIAGPSSRPGPSGSVRQ